MRKCLTCFQIYKFNAGSAQNKKTVGGSASMTSRMARTGLEEVLVTRASALYFACSWFPPLCHTCVLPENQIASPN
jgi:hypothetical protein